MYDNSFWGSAQIGGYQITIGQPGGGVYYPPVVQNPVYYPPQQAGFGLDSTGIMLLVLIGVLIAMS